MIFVSAAEMRDLIAGRIAMVGMVEAIREMYETVSEFQRSFPAADRTMFHLHELEAAEEKARKEGYEAGLKDGGDAAFGPAFKKGYEAGFQRGCDVGYRDARTADALENDDGRSADHAEGLGSFAPSEFDDELRFGSWPENRSKPKPSDRGEG